MAPEMAANLGIPIVTPDEGWPSRASPDNRIDIRPGGPLRLQNTSTIRLMFSRYSSGLGDPRRLICLTKREFLREDAR